MTKVTFILDVTNKFNSYKFFKAFKQAQHAGVIKEVNHVMQLDQKTGKEVTYQDLAEKEDSVKNGEFVLDAEQMERYGVK